MTGALRGSISGAPGEWGVLLLDAEGGELFAHRPDATLATASSAKLLVLAAAAVALESGELESDQSLSRTVVAPVADSGIWQHLRSDQLAVVDVARLIGTVSDNLATNVLIDRLGGVGRIAEVAAGLGITDVALHDIVRDERGPQHPPVFTTGTAHGYATLLSLLERDDLGHGIAGRVLDWIGDGADLSMVASAFGLDPLAHATPDRGIRLWNKTGTDLGVRADSGVVVGNRRLTYSCLVNWTPDAADAERDEVLRVMRLVGAHVRALAHAG